MKRITLERDDPMMPYETICIEFQLDIKYFPRAIHYHGDIIIFHGIYLFENCIADHGQYRLTDAISV